VIIRENHITHTIDVIIVSDPTRSDPWRWSICCAPAAPCVLHTHRLNWTVTTICNLVLQVKGRPKKGNATCLTCLAVVSTT
jgi:hypothetical protein